MGAFGDQGRRAGGRALAALLCAGALAGGRAAAQPAGFLGRDADDAGVKIHYVVTGAGPLVVMIHGFPDYWGTWKPLMRTLSADGYRTAALDLRGYDLSDKPKGVEAYAMPHLIADVAAVVKAEGRTSAIVIGHDWGAAIAWQVAMTRPDIVDRLVILSVPHPAGFAREMAQNKAQQAGSQYARDFQKPGAEAGFTPAGLAGWVKDPEEKPGYLEAFGRSDFTAMLNYYRANYPRIAADGAPPQTPPITVPVLVIHGLKDRALNAAGHAGVWDHVTADTTLLMIPSAGHFVQHDAEALVDRTIKDWLDARRTPAP
jgi:pimeloyl-ACP methyl ester carboxylesterase